MILPSNFRPVLNVVFFLLADYPASEFYVPTFRNTLFHLDGSYEQVTGPMKMELTECSETSAHKIQMPGNQPKERLQHDRKCPQIDTLLELSRKPSNHSDDGNLGNHSNNGNFGNHSNNVTLVKPQ
jgi:hypothetical protein